MWKVLCSFSGAHGGWISRRDPSCTVDLANGRGVHKSPSIWPRPLLEAKRAGLRSPETSKPSQNCGVKPFPPDPSRLLMSGSTFTGYHDWARHPHLRKKIRLLKWLETKDVLDQDDLAYSRAWRP